MTSFEDVLKRMRGDARNKSEQGRFFELLMRRVLPLLREYDFADKKVWLWEDWLDRERFAGHSGRDLGIDLVAEDRSGAYWAIQCKFFDEGSSIQKSHLDSFFNELGKEPFENGLIISANDDWSANAEKALEGRSKPVGRLRFRDLAERFDWDAISPEKTDLSSLKELLPLQIQAHDRVIEGFENHDRGRLIMACGTGKTLTSLHIAQTMVPQGGRILFLVPSIALISQSLREWADQQDRKVEAMRYLAVCSDEGVDKRSEDIRAGDLALPATTDAERIGNALCADDERTTVVFCTYQSLDRIHEAQELGAPAFDLAICDEAHRTTGVENKEGERSQFSLILDGDYVRAAKRLFMTATPRLYSESAKSKAKRREAKTFSMDDETEYGPEFHRLSFSTAVERKMLSDYRVLILSISENATDLPELADVGLGPDDKTDDRGKIIGCHRALRFRGRPDTLIAPPPPERRLFRRRPSVCTPLHLKPKSA